MASIGNEPRGQQPASLNEEDVKTLRAAKEAADALTNSFREQQRIVQELQATIEKVALGMQKSGESTTASTATSTQNVRKFTRTLGQQADANRKVNKSAEEVAKTMEKRFTTAVNVAGVALTGFKKSFSGLLADGKAILGFIGKMVSGFFSVGKAILAIPFKMMNALFEMASNAPGGTELAQAYENVREQFGDLKSGLSKNVIDVASSMGKLDNTGVSAMRIFGNLAKRTEAINKLAAGMGMTIHTFGNELATSGEAMARFQRGLGMSEEQVQDVARTALREGKNITKVFTEITKQTTGMSKAFGINAKIMSRDMAKAMADTAHFAHLSTKEMAAAVAYANKLGLSIDKLTSAMDGTATFDQAAEQMGKLNETFGTNIDATEVMMSQNAGERYEIIRKGILATGRDMTKLNMQERMLLKQTTGYDDAALDAMIAGKNLGVTFDKVGAQAARNANKVSSMTDALKDIAPQITRIVDEGPQSKGGIFDRFVDGALKALQASAPFMRIMQNIKRVFAIAYMEGMKVGRMFLELFPGVKETLTAIGDMFDPRRYQKMFDGLIKAFDVFKTGGSGKIEDFMDAVKKNFFEFFDSGKSSGKKVIEGFKTFFKTVFNVLVKLFEYALKEIPKLGEKLFSWLTEPDELTGGIKKSLTNMSMMLAKFIKEKFIPISTEVLKAVISFLDGKDAGNLAPQSKMVKFLSDVFGPLGPALKELGKKLTPLIVDLVANLATKLWELLKEVWSQLPLSMQLLIGAKTFAPFATTMVSAVVQSIGREFIAQKVGPWFAQLFAKKGAEAAGSAAADAAGKALQNAGAAAASQGAGAAASAGGTAATTAATTAGTAAGGSAVTTAGGAAAAGATGAAPAAASAATIGVAGALGVVASGIIGAMAGWEIGAQLSAAAEKKTKEAGWAMDDAVQKFTRETDPSKRYDDIQKEMRESQAKLNAIRKQSIFADMYDYTFGTGGENERQLKSHIENLNRIQKAANAEMIKKTEDEQKKLKEGLAAKDKMDIIGPITIENAAEKLKKVDDLAKQLMSKDFDLNKQLQTIRDKLKAVDFKALVPPEVETQIEKAAKTMDMVRQIMGSITDIGILTKKAADAAASSEGSQGKLFSFIESTKIFIGNVIELFVGKSGMSGVAGSIEQGATIAKQNLGPVLELFKSLDELTTGAKKIGDIAKETKLDAAVIDKLLSSVRFTVDTISARTNDDEFKKRVTDLKASMAEGGVFGSMTKIVIDAGWSFAKIIEGLKTMVGLSPPSADVLGQSLGQVTMGVVKFLRIAEECLKYLQGAGINVEAATAFRSALENAKNYISQVSSSITPIITDFDTLTKSVKPGTAQRINSISGDILLVLNNLNLLSAMGKRTEGVETGMQQLVERSATIAKGMAQLPSSMGSIVQVFGGKEFSGLPLAVAKKNLEAFKAIVSVIQEMEDSLVKLPNVDISTKMSTAAGKLGLGSSGVYTVKARDVVINIHMQVTMDAGEVERAIVHRSNSVIRDRINFAIGGGKGDNAQLPQSLTVANKYPVPVATNVVG